MDPRTLRWTLLALALQAPLCAQSPHTVFFRGPAGGFGALEEHDSSGGAPRLPFGSNAIRLLPLEVNARTALGRAEPGAAWRGDDVPGAGRIQLPASRGSLFHYETIHGGIPHVFGFFRIDSDGRVERLFERKGTGPLQDGDPFLARVGTARDGRSFLCATTPEAGGDLLEVEFGTGLVHDRTAADRPLDFRAGSLLLAPQWGVAVHATGVRSFARTAQAQSVEANFGAQAPVWFSGDVALAARGTFAAFVAGTSPLSADVYVLAPQGALARATPQPAAISRAGYLPEELDGPYLAVADDGSHCAWRTEGLAREAFLARVPWQGPGASAQLTADVHFIDTIDEVGQFGFRPNTGFVFTAGERALAVGGLDKLDVFQATLPTGAPAPAIQNLSLSSGLLAPPFLLPGTIRPEGAVALAAGGRLFVDRNRDALVLLAPQGGVPQAVLASVKAYEGEAWSGDRWILLLRRAHGNQAREVHAWRPTAPTSTQLLHSSAGADGFESATVRGDRLAFLERGLNAVELFAGDFSSGLVQPFPLPATSFGPGLAFASNGELWASVGAPPSPALLVRWVPGTAPQRVGRVHGPGFVLRGL